MKLRKKIAALVGIIAFSLIFFTPGCKTPPAPSEVEQARLQEQALWGAGGSVFAPEEFQKYENSLTEARKALEREELKIGLFRNYGRVRENFRQVIRQGEQLEALIKSRKASLLLKIESGRESLYAKYEVLNNLSLQLNQRGYARPHLAQADILFKEVDRLLAGLRYEEARGRLEKISSLLKQAENILREQLKRYMDQGQIRQWRQLAERAIEKSKTSGQTVIVISKLERTLTVYKAGQQIKTYRVGLGFNGLNDKLHAGDDATPEGEYKIIKKIGASKYGKGLLIDYPNEEDIKKFNEAKKKGYITSSTRIGGLIEIHGGGKDGLTRGCVALDDKEMDELFKLIPIGTPVTIVGTTDPNNKIIEILKPV